MRDALDDDGCTPVHVATNGGSRCLMRDETVFRWYYEVGVCEMDLPAESEDAVAMSSLRVDFEIKSS